MNSQWVQIYARIHFYKFTLGAICVGWEHLELCQYHIIPTCLPLPDLQYAFYQIVLSIIFKGNKSNTYRGETQGVNNKGWLWIETIAFLLSKFQITISKTDWAADRAGWLRALPNNGGAPKNFAPKKMRTRQAAAVVGWCTKAGDNIDGIWKHPNSPWLTLSG